MSDDPQFPFEGMNAQQRSLLQTLRLLRHLPNFAKLYWRLVWDRRVPLLPKLVLVGAIAYIVSPIDLLPGDLATIIGLSDDLLVALLAGGLFIPMCPRWVVEEHVRRIDEEDVRKPGQEP